MFGLLGALSIGAADLFARRTVRSSSVLTAGTVISLVAAATSLAAVIMFGSTHRLDDLLIGLLSGLGLGAGLFAYYEAIVRSSATVVAPLVGALSAIIPYGYAVARGASPSAGAVVGAAIALVGVVVITTGGSHGPAHDLRPGVIWGTASGVAYGIGFAVVLEASSGAGAWPAFGQRTMATLMLAAVALHRSAPLSAPPGSRTAGLLSGVLAGSSTVCYLAGVRHDPTTTVITTSMFPAASVAVGRLFFGDPMNRRHVLGIAIVLAGTIAVVTG
jgi:drug/metabolite transporter (DMT)-like permease